LRVVPVVVPVVVVVIAWLYILIHYMLFLPIGDGLALLSRGGCIDGG
jgi:hypothetical protein